MAKPNTVYLGIADFRDYAERLHIFCRWVNQFARYNNVNMWQPQRWIWGKSWKQRGKHCFTTWASHNIRAGNLFELRYPSKVEWMARHNLALDDCLHVVRIWTKAHMRPGIRKLPKQRVESKRSQQRDQNDELFDHHLFRASKRIKSIRWQGVIWLFCHNGPVRNPNQDKDQWMNVVESAGEFFHATKHSKMIACNRSRYT